MHRARAGWGIASWFALVACGGAAPPPESADGARSEGVASQAAAEEPSTTTDLPSDGGEGVALTPTNNPAAPGEEGRRTGDIQAAVKARRDEARACYDQAHARDKTLEGDIAIAWVIDPQGVVTDVRREPGRSTLDDPGLTECLSKVIGALQFPASVKGVETRATYPFNFHPRGQKASTSAR